MTVQGIRLDQVIPDPFIGFTRGQWAVLLSGFTGAGLSAGIAYIALKRTLVLQRRQFAAQARSDEERLELQLRAQKNQFYEQLASQDEALREQLDASANEASRGRALAAAADAVATLERVTEEYTDPQALMIARQYSVAIMRWTFELTDEPLRTELRLWRTIVRGAVFESSLEHRNMRPVTGSPQRLEVLAEDFQEAVVAWEAGRDRERTVDVTRMLTEARTKYINTKMESQRQGS
ncbi:hypothetical protein [Pseudarthrobacter siccitolerans]